MHYIYLTKIVKSSAGFVALLSAIERRVSGPLCWLVGGWQAGRYLPTLKGSLSPKTKLVISTFYNLTISIPKYFTLIFIPSSPPNIL